MEVFEKKIAAAGDIGEGCFHGEPDFVPLRAAGYMAFGNGVQPADGVSH